MDMLTSNGNSGNQYLRPEYLTPLPTTLDAKKSPLALLAQTCSQIGADPPSTKSLLSSLTSSSRNSTSNPTAASNGCGSSSEENERSASSSSSSTSSNNNNNTTKEIKVEKVSKKKSVNLNTSNKKIKTTPPTSSISPQATNPREEQKEPEVPRPKSRTQSNSASNEDKEKAKISSKSPSPPRPKSPPQQVVLPTSSSGSKDKLNLSGSNPFPSLFPPFQFSLQPPTSSALPPYLHSYARLKAAAGSGSELGHFGMCRDPYCTGCPLGSSSATHHLSSLAAAGGKYGLSSLGLSCPAGCISCDHPKIFPPSPHFPPLPFPLPPSLAAAALYHQQQAAQAQQQASISPYICNWIAGDAYCGKRFATSEELLQHLRSHTSLAQSQSESGTGTLSSVMDRYGHGQLPPPSISRTYPTPPLSPLSSSARYHPYSKVPSAAAAAATAALSSYASGPSSFSLPPPPHSFSALAAAVAAASANNPLSPYYPYTSALYRGSNGSHP